MQSVSTSSSLGLLTSGFTWNVSATFGFYNFSSSNLSLDWIDFL